MQAFQISHQELWPKFSALYNTGAPEVPHEYQVEGWYASFGKLGSKVEMAVPGVVDHPISSKVDGVTAWVNATHVRLAPALTPSGYLSDTRATPSRSRSLALLQGQRNHELAMVYFPSSAET